MSHIVYYKGWTVHADFVPCGCIEDSYYQYTDTTDDYDATIEDPEAIRDLDRICEQWIDEDWLEYQIASAEHYAELAHDNWVDTRGEHDDSL